MMRVLLGFAMIFAISAAVAGCAQSGTPQVETVQAPTADPLVEAKTILNNYANGMPVTSEAELFADLAAKVKEKDAAKGEILDKGLAEIKANPASAQAKARELLKKL